MRLQPLKRILPVILAGGFLLAAGPVSLADTILMPRLGFPVVSTKRLYFDVSEAAQNNPDMFKTDFEKAREMILEKQGKDKQKEVEDTLLNKLEKASFSKLSPEEQQAITAKDQANRTQWEKELTTEEEALKTLKEELDKEHKVVKDLEDTCDDIQAKKEKRKKKISKIEDKDEADATDQADIERYKKEIEEIEAELKTAECKKYNRMESAYKLSEKKYYKRLKQWEKKKNTPPEPTYQPDKEALLADKDTLLPDRKTDKQEADKQETADIEPTGASDDSRLALADPNNPDNLNPLESGGTAAGKGSLDGDDQDSSKPDTDKSQKDGGHGWLSWLNPLEHNNWFKDPEKRLRGEFFLFDIRQQKALYDESAHLRQIKLTPDKDRDKKADEDEDLSTRVPELIPANQYYIEFSKLPLEGVYDLILRGTGLRSEGPIKISNDIYWDALGLVMGGFEYSHCPPQDGKFVAQQQCSTHQATIGRFDPLRPGPVKLVRGGWHLAPDEMRLNPRIPYKSSPDTAFVTQTLLNVYLLNPSAYNYLAINGLDYQKSRYPDLLDEANWGLQFLASVQLADGSFSSGVAKQGNTYYLLGSDAKSTALASLALATGARALKHADLSYALKLLRAAEKGFDYLAVQARQNPAEVDPWLAAASYGLSRISEKPEYSKVWEQKHSAVAGLPEQVRFMLYQAPDLTTTMVVNADKDTGKHKKDDDETSVKPFTTAGELAGAGRPTELIPYLMGPEGERYMQDGQLAAWATDFFGYDPVPFKRDAAYKVDTALSDPLEWATFKTGEALNRYGRKAEEDHLDEGDPKAIEKAIEELDKNEKVLEERLKDGQEKLDLSITERAMLSYVLAVLNDQIRPAPLEVDKDSSTEEVERYLSF